VHDYNVYLLDGELVSRSDAFVAAQAAFPETPECPLDIICTVDLSSPQMGVWTPYGLLHRQSTINGR